MAVSFVPSALRMIRSENRTTALRRTRASSQTSHRWPTTALEAGPYSSHLPPVHRVVPSRLDTLAIVFSLNRVLMSDQGPGRQTVPYRPGCLPCLCFDHLVVSMLTISHKQLPFRVTSIMLPFRSLCIFTKRAYEKGVVLIECPGCKTRHLIADNIGWFKEVDAGRRIAQLLRISSVRAEKAVRRGRLNQDGSIEVNE
ncbi:DNL zinc finger-domain-containing protein [Russula earlei]|uniref:DNL zinc finger-domain-containing protein n=1 Tax=Russula earlei TaxID=71964 RepID=A0ACC0UFR0_9AGAM|nr:DNL zinc finger-domain-containing protein [Russula earlei]